MGSKLPCGCCEEAPVSKDTTMKVNIIFNTENSITSSSHSELDCLPLPRSSFEDSCVIVDGLRKHISLNSNSLTHSLTPSKTIKKNRNTSVQDSIQKTDLRKPKGSPSSSAKTTKILPLQRPAHFTIDLRKNKGQPKSRPAFK